MRRRFWRWMRSVWLEFWSFPVLVTVCVFPLAALAQPTPAAPRGWLDPVLQYLVAPLVPLIGAAVLGVLAKLVSYLHSRDESGRGFAALAVLGDLTHSVVAELEVTMRPKVQLALADGTLSPEEGAQLKAEALAILKRAAPVAAMRAAEQLLGVAGLEAWLAGMVERANAAGPASAPASVPQ